MRLFFFILGLSLSLIQGQTRLSPDQISWSPATGTRLHGSQLTVWGITQDLLNSWTCSTDDGPYQPNPELFSGTPLLLYLRGSELYKYEPAGSIPPAVRCADGQMWGDSPLTPAGYEARTSCTSTAVSILQLRPKSWSGPCQNLW
jgi:hypothetical protein